MNNHDSAKLKERISTVRLTKLKDTISFHGVWSLPKWDWKGDIELMAYAEKLMKLGKSFDELFKLFPQYCIQDNAPIGENILLNAGINRLQNLLCGAGGAAYNNANARIGVGDSSTAAVATQTGLQAASNKTYVGMDVSFPTSGSSQQSVFRATFNGSSANYSWQEFVVDESTPVTLNRLVSNQGTKISGQTWQPSLTLTIS